MKKTTSDRICIQVFAKISAAISHEIKNTLAIINENAGLLNDYAQIAEEAEEIGGLPLDRVQSITEAIEKQVVRSNKIMKNLNRYAHSGDTSLAQANLKETLSLVAELSNRQAAMKEIGITVICPQDIAIQTHLISLESLIYLTLLTLYEDCEIGSNVTIQGSKKQETIQVCFRLEGKSILLTGAFPDDEQRLLAEQVSADYQQEKNQLCITFPATVD